jgi:hypothetical protein
MLNEEILTPDEDQDMSVSQETIMKVINDKRVAWKEYGWFMKKCMSHVNTSAYKQNMENGVVPPSDVFSNSDEAFVFMTLEGNHVWWRSKAELLRMDRRKISQAEKGTLPKQKYKNCGNKLEGWNDLGLNCFNELMDEVEEDHKSNDSRMFEKEFQWVAAAQWQQGKRKRKAPVQEGRVKTRNDLDSDSDDEGSIGTA